MSKNIVAKTGNEAMAEAMRQINPDVVAAYPITPATEVVQLFSQFVADGKVKTDFVTVESEHSAMSATIGASAAGVRAMTATSSQGLALMNEMLYIASGLRLPIVMPEVNRALSSPINIHCDHSDTMGARDTGWIQIFSENSQEAYDNVLQAVRICEHAQVKIPGMVTADGFIISHCMERMEMLADKEVKDFIGEYKPERYLLDIKKPYTLGSLDLQDYYFEHRMQLAQAMCNTGKIILEIGKEFGNKFGREYGFYEKYHLDDAEIAILVMGSTAGTAKVVVDQLREKGIKAGLLKLRVFRPFPYQELAQELAHLKVLAVLDRSDSIDSFGGPLFDEVRSAMYDLKVRPQTVNYIFGLGGREINLAMIEGVYTRMQDIAKTGKIPQRVNYLGVRE
jgi:pyruvate ferredoxin oxidoreductase alpha subunit